MDAIFSPDLGMYLCNDILSDEGVIAFREVVYRAYAQCGRHTMPWRHTNSPYHVLVSEVMLQQTQVSRVLEKYPSFLSTFPTVHTVAMVSLRDVLAAWSGLGYNRRAQFLHKTAQLIVSQYKGIVPSTVAELQTLPGIGPNTAGSISAFAYALPSVFIETNVRAVFLHTFFRHEDTVCDTRLLPLIAKTLDTRDPRSWYYALMDFGVVLKKMVTNPNRRSKQYAIQSPFLGSDRRIRGAIIRFLTQDHVVAYEAMEHKLACSQEQYARVVQQMLIEEILVNNNGLLAIAGA